MINSECELFRLVFDIINNIMHLQNYCTSIFADDKVEI